MISPGLVQAAIDFGFVVVCIAGGLVALFVGITALEWLGNGGGGRAARSLRAWWQARQSPERLARQRYERRVAERAAELIDRGMDPFSASNAARRELAAEASRVSATLRAAGFE